MMSATSADPAQTMVIRSITPNVTTLSVPFFRFGKVRVGGRGTLMRLTSGTLAVFSPTALTDDVKRKVAEMGGEVEYIIAGNIEHHLFISDWANQWPRAKVLAPEGLAETRSKNKDVEHVNFSYVFTAENSQGQGLTNEFLADFDVEYVEASGKKEIVLHHKKDKVLVQADLMFNLPAIEQFSRVPEADRAGSGTANRIFEALGSTEGDAKGNKCFQWYLESAANRASFNESIRRIDSWSFDKLIPCHGETIEQGAGSVFRKIFEWNLEGHK